MDSSGIGQETITTKEVLEHCEKLGYHEIVNHINDIMQSEVIIRLVAIYDNPEDNKLHFLQIWTTNKTYISYHHPLRGLLLAYGLRNPPDKYQPIMFSSQNMNVEKTYEDNKV